MSDQPLSSNLNKGRMRWVRQSDGDLTLYIMGPTETNWVRYKSHRLSEPDNPDFSPGYKTFLKLHKLGWVLLPTENPEY